MALSRPKITTPGTSAGGGSSQGITCNAGSDVQTSSDANQSLSGSVSNGTAASWAWTLLSKPSSSSASITSASSQNATLTGIDKRGAYAAKLTVTDSDGFTDSDRVVIDYAPAAVTANAGSDVQTSSSSDQTLSGSGSGGTGTLSYSWTLVTRPSGSSASITSATSATATLTGLDNGGAYVCALTVTDSAATAVSATDTVVIDYTAAAGAAAWTDVLDLDLTAATTTALTNDTKQTVDGRSWWLHVRNNGSMSADFTNGTGLEIDFGGSSTGTTRVFLQVDASSFTRESSQFMPRIRAQISFTGMTLGNNNSFIGIGLTRNVGDNTSTKMPFVYAMYRQSASSTYKYRAEAAKGTWGGLASGAQISAAVASDSDDTEGCLEIVDIGQGMFRAGGHDGDQNLTAGLDTFRAYVTPTGFQANTGGTAETTTFYNVNSGDPGPWIGIVCKNASSGGSEAVTITRLRIQEYV